MIKDKAAPLRVAVSATWERWERDYIAGEPPNFWKNLHLLEAMYEHARALGVFPPADPLDGFETTLWLGKVVNVSTTPGKNRTGSQSARHPVHGHRRTGRTALRRAAPDQRH